MSRFLLVSSALLIALLTGCDSTSNDSVSRWNEGGTLHNKTGAEWRQADPDDKLATCADFVTAMLEGGQLNPGIVSNLNSVDDIKPYAQELVEFFDRIFELESDQYLRAYKNMPLINVAPFGIVFMGWHSTDPVNLPSGQSFQIVVDESLGEAKRSVDIQLTGRVTRETLADIARMVRASNQTEYELTFIGYYLPGMDSDLGYWATTHFAPGLEIEILGLTIDQYDRLTRGDSDDRDLVGQWIFEHITPRLVVIFHEDRKLKMETTWPDGTKEIEQVFERRSLDGIKIVTSDEELEYLLIVRDGNLKHCNESGPFDHGERLQ